MQGPKETLGTGAKWPQEECQGLSGFVRVCQGRNYFPIAPS